MLGFPGDGTADVYQRANVGPFARRQTLQGADINQIQLGFAVALGRTGTGQLSAAVAGSDGVYAYLEEAPP